MASITDIAREAQCSISTVSYALSGKRTVNAATRKRILKACERLGYVPNAAARGLRMQKTETIGLLLYPTCARLFRNIFTADVIEGVEQALIEAGYHVLIGGYTPQVKDRGLPTFIGQGRVDGVILLGSYPEEILTGLHNAPVPLLLLDCIVDHLPIDCVTTEGFTAGRQAVDYFVAKGHQRVLMLGYSLDGYNARLRRQGFLDGIKEHNLGSPDDAVIANFLRHDDGYALLRKRLRSAKPPTALFCENDTLARALVERLRQDGIDVPGAVSVIGFNDDEDAQAIGLTTFHIDRQGLGRAGAQMVLDRIADPSSANVKRRLPVTLIERDTVRALN
ncbi:MAG TPA: LacI family DNA-binding transcriptional regulator [Planctomycetota bacterium]|nr:LacI family DNA-binding transcriptional regulator [Planctomycetota bacterium]